LRAFLGGPHASASLAGDDASLAAIARSELRALMGLDAEPTFTRVFRFDRASAQMHVGHLAKMRAIHERLAQVAPGVRVAGGGYDGIGIPDCIKQGQEAGSELASSSA
jgi:oxygen-dependent protoporphyrinogen oxidase